MHWWTLQIMLIVIVADHNLWTRLCKVLSSSESENLRLSGLLFTAVYFAMKTGTLRGFLIKYFAHCRRNMIVCSAWTSGACPCISYRHCVISDLYYSMQWWCAVQTKRLHKNAATFGEAKTSLQSRVLAAKHSMFSLWVEKPAQKHWEVQHNI